MTSVSIGVAVEVSDLTDANDRVSILKGMVSIAQYACESDDIESFLRDFTPDEVDDHLLNDACDIVFKSVYMKGRQDAAPGCAHFEKREPSVTLTVELTDTQAAALRNIPDTWYQSSRCYDLPFWAFHYVPVYRGYDYVCQISDLGRQAREKLASRVTDCVVNSPDMTV